MSIKLSATRVNTFLQCKQRYWFNYVDHLPKVKNPSFKLGLAVHESLELAGNIWMEKGKFTKTDIKKITDKYKEVSVQEGIEDLTIHEEGLTLVTNRLKDFVHEAKSILGLEISFGWTDENELVTPEGVPLLGAMDKVLEIDDETILVVDYKTSKTAPTPDQLKADKQLSMYDLAASILWPGKRIIVSLDMLKHDILYSYRTEEERKEFDKYLKLVYHSMIDLRQEDVTATLNTFCGWCDFKDYCEAYKEACAKSDYKFLEASKLEDNALVTEWSHIKSVKKILDQRDSELSMIIMDKIKELGENLKAPDQEIYIRQNSKKDYDLDVVAELVPHDHLIKMVNLNKSKLEKYMDKNPAIKARVLDKMTVNFTSPFLSARKLKTKD